jgi:hypothetical protein
MNVRLINQLIRTARRHEADARGTDPDAYPDLRARLWHRSVHAANAINDLMPVADSPLP